MEPRIEMLAPKRLVGRRTTMSLARNRTGELWAGFMPRRGEIGNAVGTDLYSAEVYPPGYFDAFDPATPLEKWAAVEVAGAGDVPEGMATLELPSGLYAVFTYRGPASAAAEFYGRIFRQWLPSSPYDLADRPHFAVMSERYRGDDPDSEEEIWIPVR